jgi:hypothetical protein
MFGAREELDLGYRADGSEAASSHLRLAALHMELARQNDGALEQRRDVASPIHVPIGFGRRPAS